MVTVSTGVNTYWPLTNDWFEVKEFESDSAYSRKEKRSFFHKKYLKGDTHCWVTLHNGKLSQYETNTWGTEIFKLLPRGSAPQWHLHITGCWVQLLADGGWKTLQHSCTFVELFLYTATSSRECCKTVEAPTPPRQIVTDAYIRCVAQCKQKTFNTQRTGTFTTRQGGTLSVKCFVSAQTLSVF